MEAIGELFIAIASAFLELLVHLIAAVLGNSFLAKHSKGMLRVLYMICAASAFHLVLGLTLPFLTNSNDYLLSPAFSGWFLFASMVILIVVFATITAINITSEVKTAADTTADINKAAPIEAPKFLIYVVAAMIVFGSLSMLTVETKRSSLKEELCQAVVEKVTPLWRDRGQAALALAEKHLKRDLHGKLPCQTPK